MFFVLFVVIIPVDFLNWPINYCFSFMVRFACFVCVLMFLVRSRINCGLLIFSYHKLLGRVIIFLRIKRLHFSSFICI